MEETPKRDCAEVSKILKRRAGWIFSNIFRHYFGDNALILQGEAENGGDITFSVSNKWLLYNDPRTFGSNNYEKDLEMLTEFIRHTNNCTSQECNEAVEWAIRMLEFIAEGSKEIVTDNPLAAICELSRRKKDDDYDLLLSRENKCGALIEEIKPFVKWFTDKNRDLWQWPREEHEMFLMCCQKYN